MSTNTTATATTLEQAREAMLTAGWKEMPGMRVLAEAGTKRLAILRKGSKRLAVYTFGDELIEAHLESPDYGDTEDRDAFTWAELVAAVQA